MREELEQKIVAQWPDWFDVHGDPTRTGMAHGFHCEDGWFDLLYSLCERLAPLVAELNATLHGERFEVMQVKQKMGGVRFYTSHHTPAIDTVIEDAQRESLRTCEHCGGAGILRNNAGFLVTLCDACLL